MIRLRAGDVLLVQGSGEAIAKLKDSGSMLVLDGTTDLPHPHNAKRALAIMGFVVLAAALGFMPISVSALVGLGLMIVTGCLSWRDATTALSIPVIMITTKDQETDKIWGMRQGAVEYVVKPVKDKDLVAMINAVVAD